MEKAYKRWTVRARQTRRPSISTTKITQCDNDASKRRAQKQHTTVRRRLRTVIATTTSHIDDDSDFAWWRRRQLRTVTMIVGKRERQSSELCWKRRTVLRKGNERKKWEMGNGKPTVLVTRSTSIISFLILQICNYINFYTG